MLTDKPCGCGRTHTCPIKYIDIGKNALDSVHEFTSAYQHILLVADENTYATCGEKVRDMLTRKVASVLFYHREGLLIPDEDGISEMESHITEQTDLILGIGSGVIQDLCKCVSFQHKLPYQIIATAPSMDGYASVGAAMILDGMKVTLSAHVPEAIIGDVDILKNAPMEMIRSGYGDILGKFSCLNDWKLAAVVLEEYFCQYVYDQTYDMLQKTKDLGPALVRREEAAVQTLMEAIVGVGICMAWVGNSRPASGSEHHMSHFFEITGIVHGQEYLPHGIDVAYSAVITTQLREKLRKESWDRPQYRPTRQVYEAEMKRIYGSVAQGCIDLQDKVDLYNRDMVAVYRENEAAIRDILADTPTAAELEKMLESVGMQIQEYYDLYGAEKIHDAIL
ncbi:MAG: sn-glycerol-1-phosphate dehydrogenase, partial [Eubacteriales bacterium]|nr:sn-glycerol-1-phosphate dehydrogenase [Eubacteriales bacterium]